MDLVVECVLGIMTCDMVEDASASCRLSFNTNNLQLVDVLYKKKKEKEKKRKKAGELNIQFRPACACLSVSLLVTCSIL